MFRSLIHVLLIQEDPADTPQIGAMLAQAAPGLVTLHVARRVEEGLERLSGGGIDAVLLDLVLPGKKYLDALSEVVAVAPSAPVIVLAPSEDDLLSLDAIFRGAEDCLVRGRLDGDPLVRAVRHAIERKRAGAELAAERDLLRALMDNIPDCIYFKDTESRFTRINRAQARLLGVKIPEEAVGKTDLDFFVPDQARNAQADEREMIQSGQPIVGKVEKVWDASRARPVWVSATKVPISDSRGQVVGSVGITRDIDQQRCTEEALRASEERHRLIAEMISDYAFSYRVKSDGTLVHEWSTTDSFVRLTGYTPDEVDARGTFALYHPDEVPSVKADVEKVIAGEPSSGEYRIITRSGEVRWLRVYRRPVWDEEQGRVVRFYGAAQDITERKLTEEALRESRQMLQLIMDHIPHAIFWKDNDLKYLGCNTAFAADAGLASPGEVAGKTDLDLPWAGHAEQYRADDRAVMESGESKLNYEEPQTVANGDPRWVRTSKVPLLDAEGQAVAVMGMYEDITERRAAEEALRESEERFRTLVDAMDDIVYTLDADQRHTGIYGRWLVRLGMAKADLLGKTAREFFGAEGAAPHEEANRRALAGESVVYEWSIAGPAESRHFQTSLSPQFDGQGRVTGVVGVGREITGLKRAEAAEREQRTLAEALRDAAAALNSTLDLDEVYERLLTTVEGVVSYSVAEILLVDDGVARIARARGHSTEQLANLDAVSMPVAETEALRQIVTSGQALAIPEVAKYPGWVQTPLSQRMQSYMAAPIRIEDEVIGFFSLLSQTPGFYSVSDAERLQAFANQAAIAIQNARLYRELENYSSILEQAVEERTHEIQRAKEHVETILNSSPDAVLLLGPDGAILSTNPAFQRLFGYGIDDAVGQRPSVLVVPAQGGALESALRAVIEQRTSQRLEVTARRRNEMTFDADVALAPVVKEADLLGVVFSLRDISALKEVDRMKDSFLSTAAHELRTPLTSIRGFSELLLTREMDDLRQKRYLGMINEQSTHLASIIDDLLDVSRLEARQGLDIQPERVDLGSLIVEIVQPFVDTNPAHHFRFEELMRAPTVWGDPVRLSQIVRNLVANAVNYSPRGGPVVVSSRVMPGFLEVRIRDEGIGLTPDQAARVFDKFYRADGSNTSIGGTGLGLTICKLLVELHSGHIWVESESGVGSTFAFTVPLADLPGQVPR